MKKVSEKLEELSNDEKMIGLYDAEKEDARIKRTQMLSAERQGLNRGIAKGIEQNKKEIAINLLNENIDTNLIIKVTGLTQEEVESLK